MNVFIVNFNEPRANFNYDGFATVLASSNEISSWSVPFKGLFILKSELDTVEMHEFVRKFTGANTEMFLSKLDPYHSAGVMTKEWWGWFNQDVFSDEMVEKLRKHKEMMELEKKSRGEAS